MLRKLQVFGFFRYYWLYFFSALILFFAISLLVGKNSLGHRKELATKLTMAEIKLQDTEYEKKVILNRVKLLRADTLDKDLLDEELRKLSGMAQKDELVIYVSDKNSH
jgi:cell division protein FtsB